VLDVLRGAATGLPLTAVAGLSRIVSLLRSIDGCLVRLRPTLFPINTLYCSLHMPAMLSALIRRDKSCNRIR
jgi:hypothetical protein